MPQTTEEVLKSRFGFAKFRPHQKEVCEMAAQGEDVLLVMPTGSGKSLCYQIPGLLRNGPSLVISPLIALIEDQVQKLQERHIRAAGIHRGKSRQESRNACEMYRQGNLDFLFVAPERLAVPGFLDFLTVYKPSLIAIDEAHCISLWGHDFRVDYRMLGERLQKLRPAPFMALTATATPLVQQDIMDQLRMNAPKVFIHGFWRDNIGISVFENPQNSRPAKLVSLFKKGQAQLPAIVYVPTRKQTQILAKELACLGPTGIYHAGLDPQARDVAQKQFLEDKLQIMVATIAFGMGIDKPNIRTVAHTALPSSLEGYYQEIGRAGRDGLPSQAFLMYSYGDQRTHDYFFDLNYPEPQLLQRLVKEIGPEGIFRDELYQKVDLKEESFLIALDKLWIHGAIAVDEFGNIKVTQRAWLPSYKKQRLHKSSQLKATLRFAGSRTCRMGRLVTHFGDKFVAMDACGTCDNCRHNQSTKKILRSVVPKETIKGFVLKKLKSQWSMSLRLLYEASGQSKGLSRIEFEELVDEFADEGLLTLKDETFTLEGRKIRFKKASLTEMGSKSL